LRAVPETSLIETLLADARLTAAHRHERHEFRSRRDGIRQTLRLMGQSDAFFALACYRARTHLRGRGVPVLPWILRRLALMMAHVSIDDRARVQPGIVIPDGQVIVSGDVQIQSFVTLNPWVTISPAPGSTAGPRIGAGAIIGSGAKIIGDVEVGAGARVGTNAVVLDDVPAGATVVGMPAQPVTD
jgi:serine O-acetyltransferase